MYENLSEGVVTYVPTPRYLQMLVSKRKYGFWYVENAIDSNGWQENFEYYNKDFSEFYYQFDSIQELREKLDADDVDPRKVASRAPEMWQRIQQQTLRDWAKILEI